MSKRSSSEKARLVEKFNQRKAFHLGMGTLILPQSVRFRQNTQSWSIR